MHPASQENFHPSMIPTLETDRLCLCECAAEKADERLTPNGFAFLVAVMNNDEADAAELRDQLDMNERLEAGMFFVNAPQECGEVLEGN